MEVAARDASSVTSIKIERPLYDQQKLHEALDYKKPKTRLFKKLLSACDSFKPNKFLLRTVPVLRWLPAYQWKEDFVGDLIAGFTVAIMHIPQGMAYALLGNVPPIIGIYMAFFPVLVYFFLGTSRHNSMGTFAIVCLMTGKVVLEKSQQSIPSVEMLSTNVTVGPPGSIFTTSSPVEVATAVSFVVGVSQLIMYIFRLGILSTLLSETLVSGFVTGSAVTVLISQIKDLFGVHIPQHKGTFSNVKIIISIFQEITNLNVTATIISAITIITCVLNNELLKPRVRKISVIPIPIELIVVVTGTVVSYFYTFNETYGVKILGSIPSGLPAPTPPNLSIVSDVFVDGLVISIVAYSIALSMAMIFAQKNGYEVDANQELLAQGSSNVFGSFFLCMPLSASLSRSLIQYTVGGRTQLTSLVSCFILLFVLLWIGPLFETLPKAILASVIVVALKGMLMQVMDLLRFWRLSKADAGVWILTFVTVVFVSVDIGLLVGVILSLLTVLLQGMKPYTCLLGYVPGTDFYVDITRYRKAVQIPETKIFHYCGGINFITKNYFRSELYRLMEINPQKVLARKQKEAKKKQMNGVDNSMFEDNEYNISHIHHTFSEYPRQKILKQIVLDFSALSYMDPSAIGALKIIVHDFRCIDIGIVLAGCSDPVYELMKKCDILKGDEAVRIFPTVHDAIQTISVHPVHVTPL